MGNSIVDLGAAAVDYVSEAAEYVGGAFSNAYEYMTESPEASASETYIERKSRRGQQLYSGRDPQKPFFDFFAEGGIVGQLGELGTMSAEMSDELSMLVNGTPAGGGGFSDLAFPYSEGNPGFLNGHAVGYSMNMGTQGGPESDLALSRGPENAALVNPMSSRPQINLNGVGSSTLPAGVEPVINNSDEFIDYFKLPSGAGFEYDRRTRVALPPGAVGVSYEEYINLPKPEKQSLLSAGGGLEAYTGGSSTFDESAPYNPNLFSNQRPQPLSYGIGSTTYGFEEGGDVPLPDELAYTQGMNNPVQLPEEAGIGSFFMDTLTGNSPSDKLNSLRESGRMDNELGKALYGDGPTFMEQLVKKYNYPANIPMQDADGYAIMDPDTGMQKMMMATDMGLPEYMRTGRPRPDMPTYAELEDARAHALGAAELSRIYGPETARTLSNIKEFSEMAPLLGSSKYKDVRMDTRNNAVGVNLLKKAGIAATPQQLARMVDQKVFTQLDRILDRKEERRKTPAKDQPFAEQYFKSPEGGLDVYFPRDEEGYFDTSYIYDSGKMPKIGRN